MEDQSNYAIFRECLSSPIIQKLLRNPTKKPAARRAKGRKNPAAKVDNNAETSNDANDQEAADDCADFVDVVILKLISSWDSPKPAHGPPTC